MRAGERYGSVRDQAIIQVMRHSGIRVGALANLTLDDVALGERKRTLTIRSGKGHKWRAVPLNADLRRARKRCLAERPKVKAGQRFIGQRETGMTVSGLQDVVEKYARHGIDIEHGACYDDDRYQNRGRPLCGSGGCRTCTTDPPARAPAPGRPANRSTG